MEVSNAELADLNVAPDIESWKMDERTFTQGLKERFAKALGKEQEPADAPNISLDIYYHEHDGKEEAQEIADHFKTADVFIPEMIGWSQKRVDVVNKVSQGELSPGEGALKLGYRPFEQPYDFQLLQMVHNSNKPVAYIDYSRDDQIFWKNMDALDKMNGITKYWEYGNTFPEIIQEIKHRTKNVAEYEKNREEFMIGNLKKTINSLVENNPDLRKKAKEKGELNVLLSMGAVHTGLSHILASGDNKVSSEFSENPMIYGVMHEGLRRYRVGKDVDDAFAAKMLAEGLITTIFRNAIKSKFPTYSTRNQYVRKIVDQFSYQDVEDIIGRNKEGKLAPMREDLLKIISEKNPGEAAHLTPNRMGSTTPPNF